MKVPEWEDEKALEKHLNSKHFQKAIPKIAAIQKKDMEVNVCTPVM
ncbi:MAG: hypothetical protein PHZ11_05135 [Desulfitobacteriaceae bacterium]|nr:hypothetical protein [Desulfitobacteriaceae bacterium]